MVDYIAYIRLGQAVIVVLPSNPCFLWLDLHSRSPLIFGCVPSTALTVIAKTLS